MDKLAVFPNIQKLEVHEFLFRTLMEVVNRHVKKEQIMYDDVDDVFKKLIAQNRNYDAIYRIKSLNVCKCAHAQMESESAYFVIYEENLKEEVCA